MKYVQYRMDRQRTILAKKQIQLAMGTMLMISAMVLVMLYSILFA